MSTDTQEALILQEEELEVLQSIYPDYIVSGPSEGNLSLKIPIELPHQCTVTILSGPDSDHGASKLSLSYLPPIHLDIELPKSYPLSRPPRISSIQTAHSWFSESWKLVQTLEELWSEGQGVLCQWAEIILTGEFLDHIGSLYSKNEIRLQDSTLQLATLLTTYEALCKSDSFSRSSFSCSICMTSLKGSSCVLLSCQHVFCRACLKDFWGLSISEGDIGKVGCPDPECVKEHKEASENEVSLIVTDKELERWRWLRDKRDAELDPTIVYCPIPTCQTVVRKPPGADKEVSGWTRFRICSSCGFTFCAFCKHTWHGPLTACPDSITVKIVQQYLSLPEDSAERFALQNKYGKGVVLKLVADYLEEQQNKKWISASTTPCPGCETAIEKSIGCNHMTCAKCRQHFCYRCGTRLNPNNPYQHFSTEGSSCFEKLFDYHRLEEEWQNVDMFALDP